MLQKRALSVCPLATLQECNSLCLQTPWTSTDLLHLGQASVYKIVKLSFPEVMYCWYYWDHSYLAQNSWFLSVFYEIIWEKGYFRKNYTSLRCHHWKRLGTTVVNHWPEHIHSWNLGFLTCGEGGDLVCKSECCIHWSGSTHT